MTHVDDREFLLNSSTIKHGAEVRQLSALPLFPAVPEFTDDEALAQGMDTWNRKHTKDTEIAAAKKAIKKSSAVPADH